MKDGRTHLAHKAEHAVDLESGAVVAVTVQEADQGDTATMVETIITAAEQVEKIVEDGPAAERGRVQEVVADKGYHSNQAMVDLQAVGVRSYISEPGRGRRKWAGKPTEQAVVYGNRRRIRGGRGKALLRRRGELLERSFAHLYETGGMRRTYLRGHQNILKRLLIHAGGFNLSLVMRMQIGTGTPRGLQDRTRASVSGLLAIFGRLGDRPKRSCQYFAWFYWECDGIHLWSTLFQAPAPCSAPARKTLLPPRAARPSVSVRLGPHFPHNFSLTSAS